jgi:hypothetical protein
MIGSGQKKMPGHLPVLPGHEILFGLAGQRNPEIETACKNSILELQGRVEWLAFISENRSTEAEFLVPDWGKRRL